MNYNLFKFCLTLLIWTHLNIALYRIAFKRFFIHHNYWLDLWCLVDLIGIDFYVNSKDLRQKYKRLWIHNSLNLFCFYQMNLNWIFSVRKILTTNQTTSKRASSKITEDNSHVHHVNSEIPPSLSHLMMMASFDHRFCILRSC